MLSLIFYSKLLREWALNKSNLKQLTILLQLDAPPTGTYCLPSSLERLSFGYRLRSVSLHGMNNPKFSLFTLGTATRLQRLELDVYDFMESQFDVFDKLPLLSIIRMKHPALNSEQLESLCAKCPAMIELEVELAPNIDLFPIGKRSEVIEHKFDASCRNAHGGYPVPNLANSQQMYPFA